jgi:hypothetical protein
MEIILATQGFAAAGGSETYILTVAEQLERLGHRATIFTTTMGEFSDAAIRDRCARVADRPGKLPGACDAILVQDGVLAYQLAKLYPTTPQVFRAASDLYDLQLPPAIPGLTGAVVVLSERVARRVRALAVGHEVHRLRQPVDTERFKSSGPLPRRPRKALLLGNYLRGDRLETITRGLEEHGIEHVQVGARGLPSTAPERALRDVDIVVAKGRAALEGMACGKAVFVHDQFGTDGWITPERYEAIEADNFAGQATPAVGSSEFVIDELGRYAASMGPLNRELAISHHGARRHAQELCELFPNVRRPAHDPAAPLTELARLVRMQWLTEGRAIEAEAAVHGATEYARALEHQRAEFRAKAANAIAHADTLQAERDELLGRNQELNAELDRYRELAGTRRYRLGIGLGTLADTTRRATGRRR